MTDPLRRLAGPFYALGFVVLIVACLSLTRDYAVPIAVAIFIWVLINAFAGALRRTLIFGEILPDWLAKVIAVLAMFGAVVVSVRVVAQNIGELGKGVATGDAVLLAQLEALAAKIGIDPEIGMAQILDRLQVDAMIGWGLRTARGLITDVSLVLLYVLFLLIDERFYAAKLRALFPDPERRASMESAIARIGSEVRHYLWLMSLISFGVAVMTYLFCAIVGLKGAGLWGFLAFALNFVPTIGSIVAVVLPTIYGLLTLDDPVLLAVLLAGLWATQFIAGQIILPRVMGDRLNLATFVILFTLVAWGAMWGPAGMFMAIPITVILVMILARIDTTRPIAIVLSRDGRLPEEWLKTPPRHISEEGKNEQ